MGTYLSFAASATAFLPTASNGSSHVSTDTRSALGLDSYSMSRTTDSMPTWTLSPPMSRKEGSVSADRMNVSPAGGRSYAIDSPARWNLSADQALTPSRIDDGTVLKRQAVMLIQALRVAGENDSGGSARAGPSRNGMLDTDVLLQTKEAATHHRLDIISRLIALLKRKARVRYDLEVGEIDVA